MMRRGMTAAIVASMAAGMGMGAHAVAIPDRLESYAPSSGGHHGKGKNRSPHNVSKRSPKTKHTNRTKSAKRARSKVRMRAQRGFALPTFLTFLLATCALVFAICALGAGIAFVMVPSERDASLSGCLHASTASSEGEEYEGVRLACEAKVSMRGSP
jgi:hypothetical protein